MIFNFESFIYPSLKQFRKKIGIPDTQENNNVENATSLPAEGEIWLTRRQKSRKSQTPYQTCKVIQKISKQVYKVMLQNHSIIRQHRRNLKPISTEAYNELQQSLKIPDERPIRDLRRGGRVEE